ncbi:MAG: YlxR family protein [Proteocatella sp.]
MAQSAKTKKIPQRKCIVCSDRSDKKKLIRIVKNKEGQIFVDSTGKANGRGAYICQSIECMEKAIKNHALEKSFRVEIPKEVYDRLKEELIKA